MTLLLVASLALPTFQSPHFDPARLQTMRERMSAVVAEGKLQGIVTLVEKSGRLVSLDTFGTRKVGGSEPMKADTIFQVMSMTKPVTAVAVAILVERGKLRWNDLASDYLPGIGELKLPNGQKPASPIRIRHLLSHTSGINSDMPIDDDDRASLTLAQFVQLIERQPLRSEPNTEVRYSGPGISVAGRIVEIVTGKTFQDFCHEEIFRPLGMKDTHYFIPREKVDRISGVCRLNDNGRLGDPGWDVTRPGDKFANPAGGLYSTAADMARFMREMLKKRGGLLSVQTVKFMSTPTPLLPGSGEEQSFGMGFSVVRGPGPARNLLPAGTFGHSGAFGTFMWADPENDVVGVFMAQRAGGIDREIDLFRTMVYSALRK